VPRLRRPPPLPTSGRGETGSEPFAAPPRPAFGRGGWGVRACLRTIE
jgi:hypothetical protein